MPMSTFLDANEIKHLFHRALECDSRERATFLANACGDDALLRREVESLLLSFDENRGLFQSGTFGVSAAELAAMVLDEDEEPSAVGQRVGPYRLVAEIGRGGMGAVYQAERDDDEYEKRVAVKLIRRGMNPTAVAGRLRRERQILANLDHPNIARLLDGGTTTDGLPYIVMEYIDGQPIDKYADDHRLSTAERLEVFRLVCSAVTYAHEHSVIHRDIKPTNILINEERVPKLLDFGIAKILNPITRGGPRDATTALQVMTPEYASPEQVRGKPITTATDIYSLGLVLYELLTGHRAYRFDSKHPNEMTQVISNHQPERPSMVINRTGDSLVSTTKESKITPETVSRTRNSRPEVLSRSLRGDLDNIVLMSLRKEPERRYASVEQFSEDIRRHLSGLPIIARKDTLTYRSNKFFKRNRTLVASTLVVALICLLLGSFLTLFSVRAKRRASLAVLPFVDSDGDPSMDYLCDGITDKLLNDLSRIPGLKVPGRDSVFRYKGKVTDPGSAGTGLGVETVLTGTVTVVGSDVVIGVALSEGQSSQSIFNKQYRGKSSDIQTIEEEMAQDVANRLGWKLGDEQHRQLRGTLNAEAYNLYLKGNYSWNQRDPESLLKAIDFYKSAIEQDPKYALAYSGLANSYGLRGAYLLEPPDESFGKARTAAERALEIDPSLAEAHTSMALIAHLYEWDWDRADREFKRAIELNPNYPLAHHWYGLFLGEMNRPDEAIAEEQRALQLDPLSVPIVSDLGRVYFYARRYDESEQEFLKAQDRLMGARMGDFLPVMKILYEQTGRADKLTLFADDHELKQALRQGGMRAYWRELLKRHWSYTPRWAEASFFGNAELLARLGENDRAIGALDAAYKTHNHLMTQLKVNPAFDNLRGDARFAEILRRMKLDN
jgi:eukaryotic-like serine/threonine-protein kinase